MPTTRKRRVALALLIVTAATAAACATGGEMPSPRPVIIRSGVRLQPERERLVEIREWFTRALTNIQEDPAFLIRVEAQDSAPLPWETVAIQGDTAAVKVPSTVPDATPVYMVYPHQHLMARLGRIREWLPAEAVRTPWVLERSIVGRLADGWLFQRSVAAAPPYAPLDELLYAREFGYLDAFLLTARAEEFPEEREAWLEESPGELEAYRDWFRATFSREPPGLRAEPADTVPRGEAGTPGR